MGIPQMAQAVRICDLVQPELSTSASTFPKDLSRLLCYQAVSLDVDCNSVQMHACRTSFLVIAITEHLCYGLVGRPSFVLQIQIFDGAPLPWLTWVNASLES